MQSGSIQVVGALACLGLTTFGSAQQFVNNTDAVPQGNPANQAHSENVDFADVDLDGDFDAAFANGGDIGNQQNVMWLNQGGLQGGSVGVFVDATAARLPSIQDTSRDVEFADIDGDADPDLFVTNTSAISNQPARFWINQGPGAGLLGFYVDETSSRWIGVGGPGSSVAPALLLPGGGFINWAHDGDFADLDNDGDLDLVHSANGSSYAGQTPTRIFLNDGSGHFSEFNPSGFQLAGANIQNGDPGLWCSGTHMSNTTDTTGAQCDIALTVVDLELGDIDGDLDIDLLLGSRSELPRMFENRLDPSGSLAFRDVSHAVFPPNWAVGGGAYEQEFGDLDNDGDLDLYGLNWDGFSDVTFTNDGAGAFRHRTVIAGTAADAEEADFIDYDNDGDLDVFVANFSGQDGLFRNDLAGGLATLTDVTNLLPAESFITKDGDVNDVDQDGDYDVFTANSNNAANLFFENQSIANDVHAPRVLRLEQIAGGPASSAPRVVRVQVYDNAPYYVTYGNETFVEVTVDGGPPLVFPMTSSGGQIFRGELPGQLVGTVQYQAVSRDGYGNEGRSSVLAYVATPGSCDSQIVVYCTAKTSTGGCTPDIALDSCVSATDAAPSFVAASDVPNQRNGILFYGFGPTAVPWLGGTLCAQPPLRRTQAQGSGGNAPPANDCSGVYAFDMNAWIQSGADALLVPGTTIYAQYQGRDPQDPFGVVSSNAVALTIEP